MKTKQMIIEDGIQRLGRLKQETILRYADEIDFDQELSLYDVMMEHFSAGDLDDVFVAEVAKDMDEKEADDLFKLVREFQGLCFSNGDPEFWVDSLENTGVADYDLIAYSIFDNFYYLLELTKTGGKEVLEQLSALRAYDDLREEAIVGYLRTTFIDDRLLTNILLDMSNKESFYNIFTDEQKGVLLNYPEGTLYSYKEDVIKITSPLVLGVHIYNTVNLYNQPINMIDEEKPDSLVNTLSKFFEDDDVDFLSEVLTLSDKYRDYIRKGDIHLNIELPKIEFDSESSDIQDAWLSGDEVLGGTYDTPYSGGIK